nr:hypothetical protein [Bacteroidota bacterium]
MKKFTLLFLSVFIMVAAITQNTLFPDEVREQLQTQVIDLSEELDTYDADVSMGKYYYQIKSRGETSDTIVGYKWDLENEAWAIRNRIIKNYNDDDLLANQLFQHFNRQNVWVNGTFTAFVYGASGKMIEKTIQVWNHHQMEWMNYFKVSRDFDNELLLQVQTQFWSWLTGDWENKHLKLFAYEDDVLFSDTVKVWIFFQESWKNKHLREYFYLNGLKAERVSYKWDRVNGTWENKHKELFAYNENDQMVEVIHQSWFPGNQNVNPLWANNHRVELSWEENLKHSVLRQDWFRPDSSWADRGFNQYVYNDLDQLIEALHQVKPHFDSIFINKDLVTFEYDDVGNLLSRLLQKWNRQNEEWVNFKYWEIVLGGPENFASDLNKTGKGGKVLIAFANPYLINSPITLTGLGEGEYTIRLMDLTGKITTVIAVGHLQNEFTITDRMVPGIYILTLSEGPDIVLSKKMIFTK